MAHKSVATSPIQAGDEVTDGKRSLPKGAHVRFSHVEVDGAAQATTGERNAVPRVILTVCCKYVVVPLFPARDQTGTGLSGNRINRFMISFEKTLNKFRKTHATFCYSIAFYENKN